MSLYQTLSNRPAVTNSLTLIVLLGAMAFIAHDVRGQRQATGEAGQIYFTIDDGKTYFADGIDKIPPYDFNGQQAVRAYVYAGPDNMPFVAYLERFTPAAHQRMEKRDQDNKIPIDREFTLAEGTEVKRPGDKEWVKRASEAGEDVLRIKVPGDESAMPRLVLPGD
ncbi:MAG: hypothetical protein QM754_20510 [Tepidisphaeraceae bacterium]